MTLDDMAINEAYRDYRAGIITWSQYQKVIERINDRNNAERAEDFYE